jgi:hypothetical protein
MADYSAMKSYLEKNNLHYFTFPVNSKKPIKAVINHLPPTTPAEVMSNNLEDLGFNGIKVGKMMVTRRAPHGQTCMETLPLFLVTLTRKTKSRKIYKLNSLKHIIIKVELYRADWPDAVLQVPKL